MDFDTTVKLNIYETLARTTHAPTTHEVAQALAAPLEEVQAAFDRLHQKRLLVPEPGDPSRIRMAPPFSGVETLFHVTIDRKVYYANCVWDSFGIPAALHQDAIIDAEDAQTHESIQLQIKDGQPVPNTCFAHFAVPAARWWKDIVYT
jgi:hypothetical protein